ncbi:MAG: hypothetical protein MI723_13095 [Caulobacterales bacterium]|nr:hypothetical protein [Caulobacterales bacterium]
MLSEHEQRIEWLERMALADLHAAADAALRDRLGLAAAEIAGALVSIAGRTALDRINRTAGLGVATPASREYVADIMRRYDEAGVSRYLVHAHPNAEPLNLGEQIRAAGLPPARPWEILERDARPPPPRRSEFTLRRLSAADAGIAARLASRALSASPDAAAWLARLAARPAWRMFAAFAGDQPAGLAALYAHDRGAWLDWAAVDPLARSHGVYGDLVCARLREAHTLGCDLIAAAVPRPRAGETEPARQTLQRLGFRPATLRANFGRD